MPVFAGDATVQLVSLYHLSLGQMSGAAPDGGHAREYTVIRGILTMIG
jgi:hypothetical protein